MHLQHIRSHELAEAAGAPLHGLFDLLAALPKPEPGQHDLGYRAAPDEEAIARIAEARGHDMAAEIAAEDAGRTMLDSVFMATQSVVGEWWELPAPIEGPHGIHVTPTYVSYLPTLPGDLVDAGEAGVFACTAEGWHRLSDAAAARCQAAWARQR
jgi:hypothetical protein